MIELALAIFGGFMLFAIGIHELRRFTWKYIYKLPGEPH